MWLHSQRTALPQHSSFGPRPHLQGPLASHTTVGKRVYHTTADAMRCDALQVLLPPEQAERLRDQLIQDVSGPDLASRLAGALQTTHIVLLLLLLVWSQSRRLATWGIMDYSLLMGVHRRQFDINDSRVSLVLFCVVRCLACAVPHPPPLILRCLLAGHVGTREAACSGRSEQEEACASTG